MLQTAKDMIDVRLLTLAEKKSKASLQPQLRPTWPSLSDPFTLEGIR